MCTLSAHKGIILCIFLHNIAHFLHILCRFVLRDSILALFFACFVHVTAYFFIAGNLLHTYNYFVQIICRLCIFGLYWMPIFTCWCIFWHIFAKLHVVSSNMCLFLHI